MRYRTFGRTGWQVSEVGYGMWGMAGWTGSDDEESHASLDRAVELGCNFFDTAFAYGEGHSERLLGEALRRHAGKRLYAATKIPPKNRSTRSFLPNTSANPPSAASRTWGCRRSTCSNCMYGPTPGRMTCAGSGHYAR
jgi:aryl-alcohol dehydrogenase-like predicted oxidoreductase